MNKYYLAVDIGASGGRHILGHVDNGKVVLEEIYRFENNLIKKNGHLCWDLENIFEQIIEGLKRCKESGRIPEAMGIDTWAVDFVLLDGKERILGDTVSYRDSRTVGMDKKVAEHISERELYEKTGIQKQLFNTIYQLYSVKDILPYAEYFLMVPDYLNFRLTNVKMNEYTNATSTGMVNADSKTWDMSILNALGYPEKLFKELKMPGTVIGKFTLAVQKEVGFECTVVLPATHDTASAFLATPARDDNAIYISSGTWSLMGVENANPITSEASRKLNFTNEGGYEYRYRYLKNIMGLWIVQSIRRELDNKYDYPGLIQQAKEAADFQSYIDANDGRFLAPDSMISAIKDYCRETGQKVPETVGELMQCAYNGLSKSYDDTLRQLEGVTGKKYTSINIVGGGSRDSYLNALTAQSTKLPVIAGPAECTALGNLIVQMIQSGEFESLASARAAIKNSFDITEVLHEHTV